MIEEEVVLNVEEVFPHAVGIVLEVHLSLGNEVVVREDEEAVDDLDSLVKNLQVFEGILLKVVGLLHSALIVEGIDISPILVVAGSVEDL